MPKKQLLDILTGYSNPNTKYAGVAPPGETGLNSRIGYIVFCENAIRSLARRQSYRVGDLHFNLPFHFFIESIQQSWQSEIMRSMDNPKFGKLENLGVRLFHDKFQEEPSIMQPQKEEEQRLFNELDARYKSDNYPEFRNKLSFHIDLTEAMKKPAIGGNLHEMSQLILDWYRYVGTILHEGEPKSITVGCSRNGKQMAREFKSMMLNTLRYRKYPR